MSAEERARSRIQDAEARQLAQREFEKPIVLEAGAGTGKTATLVARVLAWTLGKGWERAEQALRDSSRGESPAVERIAARTLERVVAITFTDAAAAEMAQRVDEALGEIESGEFPIGAEKSLLPNLELRKVRGRALRGELDHLVVQTIHAYCWRLLGAYPLEAGLHPTLEVDDDKREAAGVVREVVERRLRDAYMNPDDDAALSLAEAGYGPSELEQEINLLLDQGVQTEAFRDDPLAPARVRAECARLHDAVAALCDEFGKALGAATRVKKATEVVRALEQTREHLAVCRESPENLGALIESLRECWDDTRIDRLKNWEKNVFKQGERNAIDGREARLAELASAVRAPLVQWLKLDVDLFQAARKLLVALLDEVEDVMRRNGKVTFSGLLIAAAGLVGNHPDVARRLRSQIDQILVDEFQDTDPCQCAIIEALALEGKPGERPGLFIVGDPKQSIYGWRSADLLAYEKFLDRVCASGGEKHPLTVNYRSVPAILEEVSRVIGPVMLREPGLQPEFEPLVACPDLETAMGFDADRFAPVEYWLSADADADGLTKTTAGRAALLEAQALAADLRRLHDVCGVGWGDPVSQSRRSGDLSAGVARGAGPVRGGGRSQLLPAP
jgi:ATP-dependent helicase/nuclease subunit A